MEHMKVKVEETTNLLKEVAMMSLLGVTILFNL